MEGIKLNNGAPGFKSLEGVGLDGRRFTAEVIKPGKPYPVAVGEKEAILVTNGVLKVTCDDRVTVLDRGRQMVIPGGQKVTFEAQGADVSFHRVYGDVACMSSEEIKAVLLNSDGNQIAFFTKSGNEVHGTCIYLREVSNRPGHYEVGCGGGFWGSHFELESLVRVFIFGKK